MQELMCPIAKTAAAGGSTPENVSRNFKNVDVAGCALSRDDANDSGPELKMTWGTPPQGGPQNENSPR